LRACRIGNNTKIKIIKIKNQGKHSITFISNRNGDYIRFDRIGGKKQTNTITLAHKWVCNHDKLYKYVK
jgi:hypothetical protein